MKYLWIGAVLLLLLCPLRAVADMPAPMSRAPVVAVSEVTSVRDTQKRRYTGRLESPASVALVARVAGEILEVGFHDGDYVKSGQLLYQIDPVRYEAAVKSAEGKVMQCRAEYAYAKSDLARNRALFKRAVISKDVLESSERTEKVTHGELLSAEAELITAKDDLRNTKVIAPITGRIGVTAFTAGNYVTLSSGTMVTLIQTDPMRVRFALSIRDLLMMFGSESGLRENGRVRIRLADDTEYETEGRITIVDNAAGGSTDTLLAYAEFPNPQGRLVAGGTVVLTLSSDAETKPLPAVMPSAVLHDRDGAFVYVVKDDSRAEKRRVKLGNLVDELQTILSGLSVHELVVVDGTHKVVEGMPVEYAGQPTADGQK